MAHNHVEAIRILHTHFSLRTHRFRVQGLDIFFYIVHSLWCAGNIITVYRVGIYKRRQHARDTLFMITRTQYDNMDRDEFTLTKATSLQPSLCLDDPWGRNSWSARHSRRLDDDMWWRMFGVPYRCAAWTRQSYLLSYILDDATPCVRHVVYCFYAVLVFQRKHNTTNDNNSLIMRRIWKKKKEKRRLYNSPWHYS